jgi:hypothetical protein
MTQVFAYVGINAAGSVRAVVIDDPKFKASTAKLLAEWVMMGRTVERMDIAEAHRRMALTKQGSEP